MKIILESHRLILTTSVKKMANSILEFYQKNRDHLRHWEEEKGSGFYTVQAQKIIIKYEQNRLAENTELNFWITKKNSIQVIGKVSVFGIIGGNFSSCIVGYKLDQEHVGYGYMNEALEKVIEFLFNSLNIRRIEINILPENERSLNVVKRLNFTFENEIKEYIYINGVWRDHLRFVKINQNWRNT